MQSNCIVDGGMNVKPATLMMIILAATIAGCGTFKHQTQTSTQNLPESERPDIKTSVDGVIPVNLLAEKQVFVSFKNSEKLTKVLANIVEKNGGKIALAANQADLILEGHGEFAAIRQYSNRRARADVGEAFEKGGEVSSIDRNVNIVISPGGALLNAGQATVLATGVGAVADITGFRGWFNNLVAGDPDGVCFQGCEYRQAVAIEIALKGRDGNPLGDARITSRTAHKKLLPVPLINAVLERLSASGTWVSMGSDAS